MIRLLVDGVAFQRRTDSAGLWRELVAHLVLQPDVQLLLLDRGNAPAIGGLQAIPFPAHQSRDAAFDALLIQRMCDQFKVDAFLSTGNTSPVATPALAVLPLCLEDAADEQEVAAALAFAQHYVCTGKQARAEFVAVCPDEPAHRISESPAEPALLAEVILRAAHQLLAEARAGDYDEFFREWTRIRRAHAAVDWAAA